jgi:hypothetical protein
MMDAAFLSSTFFLVYFSGLSWVLAGWRENVLDTLRVVSLGVNLDCELKSCYVLMVCFFNFFFLFFGLC